MKIIVLSANSCWYLYNFRSSTIKKLIKEKYKVVCVAPKDSFYKDLISLGCELIFITFESKSLNPINNIYLIIKFWKIFKKIKPFIIFNFTIKNNIFGSFAASLLNIPVINNVSGLGTSFINNNLLSKIVLLLYKLSQKKVLYLYFQNEDDKEYFVNQKIILIDKAKILPGSGVNTTRFQPKLISNKRADNILRFFYFGRFIYDKGLLELIQAFEKIKKNYPNCELWLAGAIDPKNKTSISQKTIDSWGQITGVTIYNQTNMIENLLSQVDCVVLPSYREGMPKSLLEACSMELPVVATNVPGCRSIIEDGFNGFLFSPKDTESLVEALKKIIDMPIKIRKEMGYNGRKLIKQKFSEEIVVKEILKNIQEVKLLN
tara:strand:- start:221 stop:1345 length:1125 start_codon:yes stop_codon:yes gene_type:complete